MCTNCNNTPVSPCSVCNRINCSCQYGCYDFYDTGCVKYSGDTLNCLDVSTGDSLTDILGLLNLKVCSLEAVSGLVKADPSDTVPADLQNKLQAGVNIVLTPVGSGSTKKIKIDAVIGGGTVVDEQVKVSATDSTTGYLFDKITTSDCITWVKINSGLNEKVKAVIDWDCALLKLSSLPGWCTVIQNCQTVAQPCGEVSGISKQNSTSNSLTLSWLSSVNAINYEVKLFSDAGFTSQISSTQTVTTTSAIFTGLVPNSSYYATVKTICSTSTSDPFGAGPFETDPVAQITCPSITLNAPVTSNDAVTVSWSGGSGAISYNVYVDNVAYSGNPISSTAYTQTGLANGNHTIKVEALPCGGTPKSDSRTFNINYTPPCIAPAAPSGVSGPVFNICPNESINLNSLITNYPSGSSIEWHTSNNVNAASLVGSPSAITVSGTYYGFSKSDNTGCYSNTGYSIVVNISSCAAAFSSTPNCNAMSIQSGSFVAGGVSTGVIRIPVNVAGNGVIYYSITGSGFTSSVIAYNLSASNNFIDIPVSYDGSGSVGNHSVTLVSQTNPSGSGTNVCTGNVPVICPPCVLNSSDINVVNPTSTGATLNISGLNSGDTYDVSVYNGSGLVSAATAQSSSTYPITGLVSDTAYSVQVIKKCSCGNVSSTVSHNFNTLEMLAGSVTLICSGSCSSQGCGALQFNLTNPLSTPVTLQLAAVFNVGGGQGYGCSLIPSVSLPGGCFANTPATITIPAGTSSYTTGQLAFGPNCLNCYPVCNPNENGFHITGLYFHPTGSNSAITVAVTPVDNRITAHQV